MCTNIHDTAKGTLWDFPIVPLVACILLLTLETESTSCVFLQKELPVSDDRAVKVRDMTVSAFSLISSRLLCLLLLCVLSFYIEI